SERIPAAAGIVNLRYKSCPEMAGQDQGMIYLPVVLTIKLCPSINAFLSRRHKRFIDDISDGLNLTL
ncbi:hypothetical protein ACOY6Q_18830, partial [Enterobacter hormaechei]|uniref:hypothetical protein n=1 Tax=Enterobacter hormaechei TaxID=158836 RepID=UPI003BC4EAE3